MHKNIKKTRPVFSKITPSTTSTTTTSTTPPCDHYNWCDRKRNLKVQIVSKEKTVKEIEERINRNDYQKYIKNAQVAFDIANVNYKNNKNLMRTELKFIRDSQEKLASPRHCFLESTTVEGRRECRELLEAGINKAEKRYNKLLPNDQPLYDAREEAEVKLAKAKNAYNKDSIDAFDALTLIDKLNAAIKTIEDSCDRFVIKPDCSKPPKLFEKKKKNANKKRL
jgi:hypothetical protein